MMAPMIMVASMLQAMILRYVPGVLYLSIALMIAVQIISPIQMPRIWKSFTVMAKIRLVQKIPKSMRVR